jgi:putative serine protease PepD
MSSQNTPSPESPWWIAANNSAGQTERNARNVRMGRTSSRSVQGRTISMSVAIVMTLSAGIIGGVVGKSIITAQNTGLATSHSNIDRAPNSIAGIAARVSPSVVSIDSRSNQGEDTGSGFFLESNGTILTNNHVVEGAVLSQGKITVNLTNGKSYPATVVGRDAAYDLAVLKIEVTDAPALPLGDSDKVQVGDNVIAIGSPLGLAGTVTTGIISAKNRAVTSGNGTGESSFINALQTDAAINPGNSGGPLVDITGSVIGINSAIASLGSSFGSQAGSIGLGFAIPINQARKTAEQLIKTGTATYPIVGMLLDQSYTGVGAKVAISANAILAGGPAERAGIKPGDIVTSIDGVDIHSSDEAIVAVRAHNVGDIVSMTITRGGKTLKFSVKLIAAKK